jgi:multiple sugar transport system permease protein
MASRTSARTGTLPRQQAALGLERRSGRNLLADALVYAVLAVSGITMIGPLVWMVATSLKSFQELYVWPPQLLPAVPLWENYAYAWTFVPFERFFVNSTVVSVTVTLGELVTSSLGGYVFARMRFPGRDRLFLLYLATLMIPGQVLIVPLYVVIRALGWLDSYAALIVPWLASAYGTFLIRQYMLTLPRELEDAARVEGANHWTIYSRVILPLCGPALATLAVLTFLANWNSFLWPLIMTNRETMRTVPIGLAYFTAAPEQSRMRFGQWQLYMAAATFSMLPTLTVFLAAQRYFVRGVVLSGLKG